MEKYIPFFARLLNCLQTIEKISPAQMKLFCNGKFFLKLKKFPVVSAQESVLFPQKKMRKKSLNFISFGKTSRIKKFFLILLHMAYFFRSSEHNKQTQEKC